MGVLSYHKKQEISDEETESSSSETEEQADPEHRDSQQEGSSEKRDSPRAQAVADDLELGDSKASQLEEPLLPKE